MPEEDDWRVGRVERRGNGEYVTRSELRETLQPLFDQKARVEPALRFYEAMRLLGLEELLPLMLKEERVHQVLRQVGDTNWRKVYRWGLALGAVYAVVTVTGSVVAIGHLIHLW